MTVTLAWLLAEPAFGLRLVAGPSEDRSISWAHAVDAADPTPWLTGGELILTTGLRLGRSTREQREYVERLAGAEVSALGFGVGVRFGAVPVAIREACEDAGLPLVEVPLATAFIAITQAVTQRLSEQEVERLQRALTNQRTITRTVVRGGLRAAVALLGKEDFGCHAAVLDEYGVVMASTTTSATLLDRIDEEHRRVASAARPGTTAVETPEGILELQTLQGRSGVCGWLAVRHTEPLSATDRLLVNQAAGLVTLQLDWPAELEAAYHDLGGALLALLLDADTAPGLERHLWHFGFGARDQVVLAMVPAQRRRKKAHEQIAAALERSKRPHVVTTVEDGVAAVLLERDAEQLVEVIGDAAAHAGVTNVVVGVSGTLPQTKIAEGLEPAQLAAAAARREERRVGWFRELTLSGVLGDDAIRDRVWELAGPAMDALGAADAGLLPTLEAYLHHNGSWEAAARSVGVHRHTLKARIAKVEEVTGLGLDVAENRVLLMLALMSRPAER